MRSSYRRAASYAWHFDHNYYRDLLHDAWLIWYNKTGGRNLLNEHEGVISKVIKNEHWNNRTRNTFMWRGEIYQKIILSIEEDHEGETTKVFTPHTTETPESLLEYSDAIVQIRSRLSERGVRVFDLLMMGFTRKEIAFQLFTYQHILYEDIKRIKELITRLINKTYINPFYPLSTTTIRYSIGLTEWKSRPRSKFELELSNETFELWRRKNKDWGYLVRL